MKDFGLKELMDENSELRKELKRQKADTLRGIYGRYRR